MVMIFRNAVQRLCAHRENELLCLTVHMHETCDGVLSLLVIGQRGFAFTVTSPPGDSA